MRIADLDLPGMLPGVGIVGKWESVDRSQGGIGNTLEFHADSVVTQVFGAMVDFTYRVEGGSLITTFMDASTGELSEDSYGFRISGDTLIQTDEDSGQEIRRMKRVETLKAGVPPIVGTWSYQHSAGGTAFETFAADGNLYFRRPFRTDTLGTYSVYRGDRLRMIVVDSAQMRIEITTFRFVIEGAELMLSPARGPQRRYNRAPGLAPAIAQAPLYEATIDEPELVMSLKEIAREHNRSWVTTEIVSGSSVGTSMWIMCQVSHLTKLRGFRYFVVLEQPNDVDGAMELGFLQSNDVNLKTEFGKEDFEYGEGDITDTEMFAQICGPSGQTGPASTSVAGTYSLTFTAASSCGQLPVDRRSRTYTATISQTGSILDVVLSGARFWEHSALGRLNRFTGAIFQDQLIFGIQTPGWGIVEEITPTTYWEMTGVAQATIGDSMISGTVDGGVGLGEDLRDDARHVSCVAADHAFTLTRQ